MQEIYLNKDMNILKIKIVYNPEGRFINVICKNQNEIVEYFWEV